MDRRRNLLKIAALRSEREQQVGVNCTKGYLQLQSAGLLFEGPRTLECLFRYIPSDKMQVIAGFGISMIEIYALTTNQLRVYCGGGNATVDIVPGDSYLVDVAYDGTTAICYLNGAEAARFPVTGYKITDLFRAGSNTYIPKGSLVFCRHYNYALSAEEVAAHYNGGDPAGYVVPLADKYRWEASESNIGNIRFYPNNEGSGVTSYLEDNANGFTGRYAHIIWGSSGLLSVYSYQFMGHPVGCVVEAKFKYRSNAPVRVLADNSSLPINMEDAADATIVYRTTGTNISGFSVTVPNADANSWVEIQPVSLRTLGCIAEYLPQNLKNIEIKDMGFTPKTFEFDMDSPYYQRVLESGELESGRKYRVDYVVEEWDIAPAVIGSCGISCGVLSTVGTQYWPNLSAAKLGENQHVVVDTKETGTPYMFVYASNPSDTYTSRRLKVTVHSVKMLGCVAEYLPQNLVGSPHDDPIEIVGKNSYTWTGADAPVSFDIKINRVLSVGGAFRITGSVSNYKSGTPYLNLGHNSIAYLPKDNSPFTLVVTLKGGSSTLLPYIYIYGGSSSEDKQLTITVDSIEPVPGVATSWLDSAKQLPLNDEYLPPLLQSDGGYDLTANRAPEIIIK